MYRSNLGSRLAKKMARPLLGRPWGRHPPSWSSELLERSLQVWEHACYPPVRLDNLTIREDVLLGEAVARMVIQVQTLGLFAKRDVPTWLPSLGTELLETNVFVLDS